MQVFNVDAFGRRFRGHLGLQELALLLVAFVDGEPLELEVFDYQSNAVCGVLHQHFEFKLMITCLFDLSPDKADAIGVVHVSLDLLERGQSEPGHEASHILDLMIRL